MAEIPCFLLEPTRNYRRSLRRYTSPNDDTKRCPDMAGAYSYHNASLLLDEIEADQHPNSGDHWPHEDSRWPQACSCGYRFEEGDEWYLSHQQIYRRVDTGELLPLRGAPAGAMWLAPWYSEWGSQFWKERGGGPHLIVKTPGGEWDVDSEASNGPGWQRSGEPPNVTATPSILCNQYHGWLREGKLVDA